MERSVVDELQESRELVEAAALGLKGKKTSIANRLECIAAEIQREINELEKKNYQI